MYHQSVAGFDISHAWGRFQGQLDNMLGAKQKLDLIVSFIVFLQQVELKKLCLYYEEKDELK